MAVVATLRGKALADRGLRLSIQSQDYPAQAWGMVTFINLIHLAGPALAYRPSFAYDRVVGWAVSCVQGMAWQSTGTLPPPPQGNGGART